MYRIHSMHGPTCHVYKRLTDALNELWRMKLSNGGLYRVIDETRGKEIASIDTFATYEPLCYEANQERRERKQDAAKVHASS